MPARMRMNKKLVLKNLQKKTYILLTYKTL